MVIMSLVIVNGFRLKNKAKTKDILVESPMCGRKLED